ncbi:DUF3108 domain-containing protein [Paludibacter sp. 221]|uniref:DUF3108 domain-containing protein n=1 Tax=Paludibacter sp. 221 TaxID=2302939 RepID=UPI0013D11ADB|nr:DUF3108 domain-containing protein [Paludibacter sp. 221]
MSNKIYIFLFCSLLPLTLLAEEKITLRAYYGFINAGYAELSTREQVLNGEKLQHTRLEFKTTNLLERLFRFYYVFDSYHDTEDFLPVEFSYDLEEKKAYYNDTVRYFHAEKKLQSNLHGERELESPTRDLLSVISYLRKIDWSSYQEGDKLNFDIFFRKEEVFPVQIEFQGYKDVSVKAGDYNCIKLYLTSKARDLFDSDSKVAIFLSNDGNKIPVSFSVEMLIGAFKLDLEKYEK